ncbi:hypothetical protein KSF78_0008928 [Schistosoma japonicum]|nr:hypothetical protein KSF78_0008928 [Schistosoma japonicum]
MDSVCLYGVVMVIVKECMRCRSTTGLDKNVLLLRLTVGIVLVVSDDYVVDGDLVDYENASDGDECGRNRDGFDDEMYGEMDGWMDEVGDSSVNGFYTTVWIWMNGLDKNVLLLRLTVGIVLVVSDDYVVDGDLVDYENASDGDECGRNRDGFDDEMYGEMDGWMDEVGDSSVNGFYTTVWIWMNGLDKNVLLLRLTVGIVLVVSDDYVVDGDLVDYENASDGDECGRNRDGVLLTRQLYC